MSLDSLGCKVHNNCCINIFNHGAFPLALFLMNAHIIPPFKAVSLSPIVPHLFPCIRLDDRAKLHYTGKHIEPKSSSHSSAAMKLAISHCTVITIGFCQMQLRQQMPGLQLWFDLDWLWYELLLYLSKVLRVKHIGVLDLFRRKSSPEDSICSEHVALPIMSPQLLDR